MELDDETELETVDERLMVFDTDSSSESVATGLAVAVTFTE